MKKRLLALFVAMTLVLTYAVPAVYATEDEVKTVTVTALPEFPDWRSAVCTNRI